jgi:small subunit ribosomal protein S1
LHVGQEVEVQVLGVDKDKKKIALSIKRAEVDPWTTVEQRYQVNQLVKGIVTKIAPFGAFARIEDGVEGLIHLSELLPGQDPKTALHEGQELTLRILRIESERRRLGLSLRQAAELDAEPAAEAALASAEEGFTSAPATPPEPAAEETSTREPARRQAREKAEEAPKVPESAEELTAMAAAFHAARQNREREEAEDEEQPSPLVPPEEPGQEVGRDQ